MRTRSIVLSIASVSLLSSCDPRVFDDLEDTLWVRADTKPSDSDSNGFGVGLIGSGGPDYQYFVASKSPPAIHMAKVDANGDRSLVGPASPDNDGLSADILPTPAVMANDPGSFGDGKGNTALGIQVGGTPTLYMLRSDGGVGPAIELGGDEAPTGISFGESDASGATDLFAIAGEELNVVADYKARSLATTASSCSLGGAGGDVHVADVAAASGFEVLAAAGGEIVVASGSALLAAAEDDMQTGCFDIVPAAATIEAPGGEAGFGSLIRSGDFDGNGSPDLAIAAGDNTVYVFLNWTIEAPTTGTEISAPSGASAFGTSIATGDFNGDGRDELVIADPEATVGGNASAGSVYIFEANAQGEFDESIVLHDASPEAEQAFGQSMTIVEAFGGARLVVGAKDEVFSYFRTPVDGDVDFTE